jgi:phosphoglycerate dehydrogenase-like enzyme
MGKSVAAFLIGKRLMPTLFEEEVLAQIEAVVEARYAATERPPNADQAKDLLAHANLAVCSWGSPTFDAALLNQAPNLRQIIYAAGSVKPIVTPAVAERGIVVTNGAGVIAKNVAETTLGYIIVSLKNAWRLANETRQGKWRDTPERSIVRELYGSTIGVVGAGYVGRAVLELLSAFPVNVLVYDPFLKDEDARKFGATRTSLDGLLQASDVVTLHAPDLPTTRHMLNAKNLPLMKDGAVLVNTARGTLIDEMALLQELKSGRIFACLDVTDPEPPAADNPLRGLENVIITPHIAGGVTNGRLRLGRLVLDEIQAFLAGRSPYYPVDLSQMDRIA